MPALTPEAVAELLARAERARGLSGASTFLSPDTGLATPTTFPQFTSHNTDQDELLDSQFNSSSPASYALPRAGDAHGAYSDRYNSRSPFERRPEQFATPSSVHSTEPWAVRQDQDAQEELPAMLNGGAPLPGYVERSSQLEVPSSFTGRGTDDHLEPSYGYEPQTYDAYQPIYSDHDPSNCDEPTSYTRRPSHKQPVYDELTFDERFACIQPTHKQAPHTRNALQDPALTTTSSQRKDLQKTKQGIADDEFGDDDTEWLKEALAQTKEVESG